MRRSKPDLPPLPLGPSPKNQATWRMAAHETSVLAVVDSPQSPSKTVKFASPQSAESSNSTPSDPLPLSPLSSTGSMTGPAASCLPCCMPRVKTAPPRPPSQKPPAPPPATTTPAQPAIKTASVAPAPSPPRPRAPAPAPPPPPVAAMPFSPMPPPLSGAYDGDPWANVGPNVKLERESSLEDGEESPRAFMSTTMMK